MSILNSNLQVPIFYPTYEEFENFSSYVSKIESQDAHKIGLAKIIPPKQWISRKMGYKQKEIDDTMVYNPIKQEVHGKDGLYLVYNIQQKSIKLNQFQKLASTTRYATPSSISHDVEKLEKKYWENLTSTSPIYGADVSGSFYDKNQKVWNVNNLGTILDDLETEYGTKIEGVNTAYLYFGMWKSTFAWHTEDMDLYSINYLHFGAPKQWYVIPPSYGKIFEEFAALRFPSLARRCPAFLRHKMTIISPSILIKHSIPFSKMTQYENEFIITFPYAYHSGFNYGFNCAESTNFALERWIEYGKHSVQCACRHDMVKISMDLFVHKYQPELYNDWCRGINLTSHPEDEQMLTNNKIIIRSSPTKKRLPINHKSKTTNDALLTAKSSQYYHHEQISAARYACIFRNLAKFDKLKQLSIFEYPNPLIRVALCRAQYKLKKNKNKNSIKLLCLTANLVLNISSLTNLIIFNGLEKANKYRENILNGLWNYQIINKKIEKFFNQWLTYRISNCSICYLFIANKHDNESLLTIKHLLMLNNLNNKFNISNDLLKCNICHVSVHRECYEIICLALNVDINDNYDQWYCQRCTLQRESYYKMLDDRCSACLLRGGLLLKPNSSSSSSFIHAICSIYQAYEQSSSSSSSQIKSCYYCWSFCPLNYRRISTYSFVSCNHTKCKNQFHVTCGLISGCTFYIDHDYSIINARCHLHTRPHQSSMNINNLQTSIDNIDYETAECLEHLIDDEEQQQQQQHEDDDNDDEIVAENERVPIGTRVILNDINEQKLGRIMSNEISFHYAVDFGDGSYSHDMLAEDILNYDPSIEPITLIVGSNIRIKWTDGKIYSCKYLGRKRVLLYHIKIDNETRQMRRSEFSYDIQPPSPPLTPGQSQREHNYSRRQPLTTNRKRQRQRKQQKKTKRKRRCVVLSSSSSSSDEF
ncbi:unnamed protein product [Rotaria sp. Silwood1]|nr:unnamed protein product [Rotaria sp. Silwood1]CAF3750659.1 unnamed protein product [Rotaria sp. Silwood1]CAF3789054.1 unnamed protein product [Rotaria sp. Silwood1]CAF4724835.1 unnamed protein product [Rotaria sp. Silwood1]CAF4791938.1 unnamed protein product [Rotaria sp. Silwood1]